ncbi:hypothetical protein AB0G60_25500 [Streptomyces angustmyceticus]|uniref:Resolvase HTH domain-containing protein n=1 Tax=Streptomyces angustmyceticus TaxID=285578 RepID=A0A5J4LJQ9_9ACTN|nr:hypothetical protein [Streptomyces angustmyceticus]UAL68824.1 hypothetical protein K7396_21720 [Streptomyces angustmyceticus]GES32252.1 hypothetical protein San01_47390 [Streptomyces angustmyceticus]
MPHTRRDHSDYEALRPQVVALRRAGLSRRQIRDRLHVHNNDILNRLLDGAPAPDRPRHPNAKDDLRARARELRRQGRTYDEIQIELGCSKSSISLWVRDLPKPPPRTPEEASAIARRGWEATLKRREEERQRTKQAATSEIGTLTDRELFLIGVGLYWSEGSKSKPHRRSERAIFINSDPDMIRVYLAWLRLLGVAGERLRFYVHIHESADVAAAERFWADLTGVDPSSFGKTTLKKHNPKTVRKNVGEDYHGCLMIHVSQSAELYRRIEGWWYGIVLGAERSA